MPLTVEDLKPKPFKIIVKGVELEALPLRLSHGLALARVGNIFQNSNTATKEEIKQAETDLDEVVCEVVPELKDVQLDIGATMELIEQLMESVQPTDDKELKKNNVKFDSDPKA